ncbi:hypothetical protein ABIA03_001061 [Bradyrhizobium yuanmingense]|uniref:Secreted protein n=1 Tax=Bradyrhizobium yuanmingense TaxID=108015 RepID=A0ABV4GN28_9BRAD
MLANIYAFGFCLLQITNVIFNVGSTTQVLYLEAPNYCVKPGLKYFDIVQPFHRNRALVQKSLAFRTTKPPQRIANLALILLPHFC